MKAILKIAPFILYCMLFGCIKSSDYQIGNKYNLTRQSVQFTLSADSATADGNGKIIINFKILPDDNDDSLNISGFNLSVNTTLGTFAENNQQTIPLVPAFGLDSLNQRNYTTKATLLGTTKADVAKITIKYLNVEVDTSVLFYRVYPTGIKITVSSFAIVPDFKTEDTVTLQLSSPNGIPSSGTPVQLIAKDSTNTKTLGIFRVSATKTNAAGQAVFIFVLGDSTLNGVNYSGIVNLTATANDGKSDFSTTVQIYSKP